MFRRSALILVAVLAITASLAVSVSQASAAEGPVWRVLAVAQPTNFAPGDHSGNDSIVVTATNVGGAATGCTAEQIGAEPRPVWSPIGCSGGSPVVSPVTIGDSLPKGLSAVEVAGYDAYKNPLVGSGTYFGNETVPPVALSCAHVPAVSCTDSEPVDPGDTLVLIVTVRVDTEVEGSGEVNEASVSGGGAVHVTVSDPVAIDSEPAPYGIAPGGLFAAAASDQAGAHPNVTTGFFLNTIRKKSASTITPVGNPKDAGFDLPPGLVGTTVGVPRCSMAAVADESDCPRDTMVGTATVMIQAGGLGAFRGMTVITVPVFNIAPAPGEPAAFGFDPVYFSARLDTSVLSNGNYGVRITAPDITAGGATYASFITIWGVPADHNGPGPDGGDKSAAGSSFLEEPGEQPQIDFGGPGGEEGVSNGIPVKIANRSRVPLLTNPSQCSMPLTGVLETDSWDAPPGPGVFATESTSLGTEVGCGQLSFKPKVSMLPDTLEAGAPAGYSFDLSLPQDTEPEALATPDVKKTTVTLPSGTVISPSAADGLGDCTSSQFGLHSGVPGNCPRDSQVGTVRVKTPALEERLTGQVYLGAPECTGVNGACTPQDAADGRMIHLYAQFFSEGEGGIVVKLEGVGQINQQTGQITTTFDETPQLPFSEFQLTLQGGERATLANPRTCGEVSTTVDLTPWSTPFTPDATPTSNFDIDENCFAPQFNPSFAAGTTSNQAGGFTPFTVAFGRSDADEFLNGLQVKMPLGLLGMISKVKLCEEPQANAGTCGPESQIGEVNVETGPGADPFLVTGGKVYITGPYRGAPYGLSIVVPAKAGPYTLAGTTGNGTVVNRSAISADPGTSQLTVTADPLPTELDGIPLQLRLVNVIINRPEFTFNPTSCNKLQVGATMTSTEAASATQSPSFQVTNCGGLMFQPSFSVSTTGKTSKALGASLDAKLTYPATGQGTQANIARVKVELPPQLPSPLATLQKACTAQTFAANPANCPTASVVGIARVSTPVLGSQLTGPVYFVSNGGEAFPNLVIVLQGGGVRVDLVGDTLIKGGVTSTTFKTVPDVPFSSFELYLPQGQHSALVADGNLCKSKLVMPTEFIAQNGAAIHEKTKIAVTNCPKAKKASKKRKAKKASSARKSSHGRRRKS
jgi:hypothetical protein